MRRFVHNLCFLTLLTYCRTRCSIISQRRARSERIEVLASGVREVEIDCKQENFRKVEWCMYIVPGLNKQRRVRELPYLRSCTQARPKSL